MVRSPETGAAVDEAAILAALERRLARFKLPKRVLFLDELPRNAMGKVQKNLLPGALRGTLCGGTGGDRLDQGRGALAAQPILDCVKTHPLTPNCRRFGPTANGSVPNRAVGGAARRRPRQARTSGV